MKTKCLKITIPEDILLLLNETEKELENDMKIYTAIMLYVKEKITIGKASQFAGMSRYDFENLLSENRIPISLLTYGDVIKDTQKLGNL